MLNQVQHDDVQVCCRELLSVHEAYHWMLDGLEERAKEL